MKMIVKQGEVLQYPDGTTRGAAGYVVDTEASFESAALAGQGDKLEPCADYVSADAADRDRLTSEPVAPAPPAKKATKKKATKKKAKKKATKKKA